MPLLSSSQRFIIPDLPTTDDIVPFLRQIEENKWYSNFGPLNNSFERIFAQAMAAAHGVTKNFHQCVALSSGYHALSVALRLMGIGPKKRVLIPAVTFPACPLAAQNLGAEAILADIDPESWVLTPQIAKNIAQKTKIDAVMPVCVYGIPLPAQEWDDFTKETGIPVVIDAAAAVESQRYLEKGFVAHSLHALKPFGIGEGGLLMILDKETVIKARKIINFGTKDRITYEGGENAKMSEFHAAVALAQMERWESIKARRRNVYETYKAELKPLLGAITIHPKLEEAVVSNLMITIKSIKSPLILTILSGRGIPAHRTYLPPLYAHPHFASLAVADGEGRTKKTPSLAAKTRLMRGAEMVNETVIGLPFHSFMTGEEIHHVVKILGEVLGA